MRQEWLGRLETFRDILSCMEIGDLIEILIIAFLLYHVFIWIKTSRAWNLLKAVIVIAIFLLIAYNYHMDTILWITSNLAPFAVTAFIVMLQPELRRAFEELGKKNVLYSFLPTSDTKREEEEFSEKTINEIARACEAMSKVRTGALIVIEAEDPLTEYERTGIDVDGIVTSQLLINIFEHNTPLHDGAVIIRGNRVTSATCYLPVSGNMDLDKELGTRHRAGVGISEVTDSLTVIVSEETGGISVACRGELERCVDIEQLKERLRQLKKDDGQGEKKHRIWRRKGRRKAENEE